MANTRATSWARLGKRTVRNKQKLENWMVLPGLALVLTAISLVAMGVGAVSVPATDVAGILLAATGIPINAEFASTEVAVVQSIRLPRVLMGILVGSSLAICGAALQGLFRNPLADPALVGVSSGAALGAVSAIVLSQSVFAGFEQLFGSYLLPVSAFTGGVLTTFVVYRIAQTGGRAGVTTLLLAGIAIGSLSAAGTGLLTYLADDFQLRTLTFWSMGSLGGATWSKVGPSALLMLAAIVIIPTQARALNAFLLGESEAMHLGFDLSLIHI